MRKAVNIYHVFITPSRYWGQKATHAKLSLVGHDEVQR